MTTLQSRFHTMLHVSTQGGAGTVMVAAPSKRFYSSMNPYPMGPFSETRHRRTGYHDPDNGNTERLEHETPMRNIVQAMR